MKITTKQFNLLSDINLVWDFLVETYDWKNDTGRAAPFFEYALSSSWMDTSYSFLDRLWFDGNKVVAFVYYEAPVTNIYFNVRKGYEFLAEELVDYAIMNMPHFGGEQQFVLFGGQQYLKDAAAKRGFKQVYEYEDLVFDFGFITKPKNGEVKALSEACLDSTYCQNQLNYVLPEGYHFVEPKDIDIVKCSKLCWYGFGHGEKGEFKDWDKYDDSLDWTPAKSHKSGWRSFLSPSPHATPEYNIIIADKNEEYVCFAGMWWVPQNKLAYMEPLCTHPDHRRKGLAAAALTEHYRRMKALGATHMTGGEDPFYKKIGYGKGSHWTFWKR